MLADDVENAAAGDEESPPMVVNVIVFVVCCVGEGRGVFRIVLEIAVDPPGASSLNSRPNPHPVRHVSKAFSLLSARQAQWQNSAPPC